MDNKSKTAYKLLTACSFTEVFDNLAAASDSLDSRPKPMKEIGYVRADYDGHRWWGQYFPCRKELRTDEIYEESQEIYRWLVEDMFPNLSEMGKYCDQHPEARAKDSQDYNFYVETEMCNYWLRLRTISNDYNLYLNMFSK